MEIKSIFKLANRKCLPIVFGSWLALFSAILYAADSTTPFETKDGVPVVVSAQNKLHGPLVITAPKEVQPNDVFIAVVSLEEASNEDVEFVVENGELLEVYEREPRKFYQLAVRAAPNSSSQVTETRIIVRPSTSHSVEVHNPNPQKVQKTVKTEAVVKPEPKPEPAPAPVVEPKKVAQPEPEPKMEDDDDYGLSIGLALWYGFASGATLNADDDIAGKRVGGELSLGYQFSSSLIGIFSHPEILVHVGYTEKNEEDNLKLSMAHMDLLYGGDLVNRLGLYVGPAVAVNTKLLGDKLQLAGWEGEYEAEYDFKRGIGARVLAKYDFIRSSSFSAYLGLGHLFMSAEVDSEEPQYLEDAEGASRLFNLDSTHFVLGARF